MYSTCGLAPKPGAISTMFVTSRDETKPPAPASKRKLTPTPRIEVRSPPPGCVPESPHEPEPELPELPVPAPCVIQMPAVVVQPGSGLHRSQSATPSRLWSMTPAGAEPVISNRPPANSYFPWLITMYEYLPGMMVNSLPMAGLQPVAEPSPAWFRTCSPLRTREPQSLGGRVTVGV